MENFKIGFEYLVLIFTIVGTLAVFIKKLEEWIKKRVLWLHVRPRWKWGTIILTLVICAIYGFSVWYVPHQHQQDDDRKDKAQSKKIDGLSTRIDGLTTEVEMEQSKPDKEIELLKDFILIKQTNSNPEAAMLTLVAQSFPLAPVDVVKPIDISFADLQFDNRKTQLEIENDKNEISQRSENYAQEQRLRGPVLGPYQSRMDTFPATLTSPIFDYTVTKLKSSLADIATINGDVLLNNYRSIPNPIMRSDATNSEVRLESNSNWDYAIGFSGQTTMDTSSARLETILTIANGDNLFTLNYSFPTQPSVMLHKWNDSWIKINLTCGGTNFYDATSNTNNYKTNVVEALTELIGATNKKYPIKVIQGKQRNSD